MKHYTKQIFFAFYILLFTIFTGCGDGGDKGVIDNECDVIVTKTFSGVAVDGYIKDADVCLDINNNSLCDQYEPTTRTLEDGSYSFGTSKTYRIRNDSKIILKGGTDIATGKGFNGFLKTSLVQNSDEKYVISPLTTLVALYSSSNDEADINASKEFISSIFDLNISDIDKDPVALAKEGKTDILKVALQIQTILEVIANTQTTSTTAKDISTEVQKATDILTTVLKDKNGNFDTNLTATFNTIVDGMEQDSSLDHISQIKSSLKTMVKKIDESMDRLEGTQVTPDILNATQTNIVKVQDGFNAIVNNKLKSSDTNITSVVTAYSSILDRNISNTITNSVPTLYSTQTTIDENLTTGSLVATVPILDHGSSSISSMVLLGNGRDSFDIDTSGNIKISDKGVDFEEYNQYNLTAIATNNTGDSQEVDVNITINDVADVVPALFTFSQITIKEHTPAGTVVGTIDVNSSGDTNIIDFDINGTRSNDFSISSSGVITVAIVPDFEVISSYYLTAYATNSAGNSTGIAVNINISDIAVPIFNTININPIDETATAGTLVGTINFTSNDANITSITLTGDGASNFNVDNNGTITVAAGATLDYETKSSYPLSAYASNIEGNSTPTNFSISINDAVEAVPILLDTNITVLENAKFNDVVGAMTIQSTGGSPITSIGLNGAGGSNFAIDNNGTINIREVLDLDYETNPIYTIPVDANNSIGKSASVNLYVTVLNIPEVTPIVASRDITIAENITNGTLIDSNFITNIATLDGVTSYTISGDGSSNFTISNVGALSISSNANIDYETTQDYNLTLTVVSSENGYDLNSSSNINISITDIYDTPPTLANFTGSVDENVSNLAEVGYINILNTGDSNITDIVLSGVDSGPFTANALGLIQVTTTLDYETQSTYNFVAYAESSAGNSNVIDINISINNIIDTVPILENFTTTIAENTPIGTTIGNIDINSSGDSNITDFNISGTGSEYFNIDSNGTLITAKAFDYELNTSYSFVGFATNSAGNSQSVTIDINISDIEDVVPVISNFSGSLDENTTINTIIGSIDINSIGDSDITLFTIVDEGNTTFAIDTNGTISLITSLDYETKSNYNLSVFATNNAGKSNTVNVNISINNIADVTPTLQPFSQSVGELSSVGTQIGTISFDSGDSNITKFVLINDENSTFNIDINGTITIASSLDYETTTEYNLTAIATNSAGDSNSTTVNISIIDQPEDIPVLSNSTASMDENSTGGIIGTVTILNIGADAITDINLTGLYASSFDVNNSGTITLISGDFDYETITWLDLNVTATNSFGTSEVVELNISINNIPEFVPTLVNFNTSLDEDLSVGAFIGDINITNSGDTNITNFTLIGEGNTTFNIDNSGSVTLASSLDYESKTDYNLTLYATNDAGDSSSVNLTININDVADVVPIISGFSTDINESAQFVSMPSKVGSFSNTNTGTLGVILSDDNNTRAYIATGNGFKIVNIENPTTPILISTYNLFSGAYPQKISITNDKSKALVVDSSGILNILDISDENNISSLSTYDTNTSSSKDIILSQDEKKAYVASYDQGFVILDVNDTANPSLLGQYSDGGGNNYVHDFKLSSDGSKLFIADNYGDVKVVDVNDSSNPQDIRTISVAERAIGLSLSNDDTKLFVANSTGLVIMDITNINAPSTLSSYTTSGTSYEVVVSDDMARAYIADYAGGVVSLDIKDLSNPKLIGIYATTLARDLILSKDGTKLYVGSANDDALLILNSVNLTGAIVGQVTTINAGDTSIDNFTLSGTNNEDFEININGIITVFNKLDYETKPSYTLQAIATNSAGDSNSATVDISINNIVDEVPTLANFTGSVNENESNVTVGNITITNSGDSNITYIDLMGEGSYYFNVEINGTITIINPIDYETYSELNLTAYALNSAGESNIIDVNISVNNVPDIVPTLANFSKSVDENISIGTKVGDINITNSGDNNITSFTLIGEGNTTFNIDNSGSVTIASSLDYEAKTQYNLTIFATNSAGDSDSIDMNITINNVIDEVPILENFTTSIDENVSVNTKIGDINITDSGDSNITSFTISGDGNTTFDIDTNGSVTLVLPLDYENKTNYRLTVIATNSTGNSDSVDMNITINNIIDEVPILANTILNVDENASIGTIVGDINITNSGDSNISYIDLMGEGSYYFSVDNNGTITVENPLDYETYHQINLFATATNDAGSSSDVNVTITINNIPEVPILENFTTSIDENVSVNTKIGDINITDSGDSNITSFTISGDGNTTFDIDTNGSITLASSLDYETKTEYNLTIIATNSIGNSNSVDMNITINNVIDEVPILENFTASIDENSADKTIVGTVTGNSGDSNITEYHLTDTSVFSIDSNGTIKVSDPGALDYETNSSFNFQVYANNGAGASNYADVNITINDIPDVIPMLNNVTGIIAENSAPNTVVDLNTSLISIIGDSKITSIDLNGTGEGNFTVDTNGTITVASGANLDFELQNEYNLTAIATNDAGSSEQVGVHIFLSNIVETPPTIYSDFNITIGELATISTPLGTLDTNKGDDTNVTYTLSGTGYEDFYIAPDGTLSTSATASIDYETQHDYNLTAYATNGAGNSNSVDVNITITDEDEVAPTAIDFIGYVNDKDAQGKMVGKIIIQSTGGSDITGYTLSGDSSTDFIIDGNGTIKIASGIVMDYNRRGNYPLSVAISNENNTSYSSVNILVNRYPYFNDVNLSFTENNISTSVDYPQRIFPIDVDKDGDIDILSSSSVDDKIAWHENDGNNSFTEHNISVTADYAMDVFGIDLDNDGDIDVISASSSDSTVAWYENDGNENFTEHNVSLTASGVKQVYSIDLDDDGDLDIIAAISGEDRIAWYENDGNESFSESNITTLPNSITGIYPIDMDNDGDMDIVSASYGDDTVAWYENDGNESFSQNIITDTADGVKKVYAIDIDGDNDIDVLSAIQTQNKIVLYLNDGNESFTQTIISSSANGAKDVFAIDMNNDGYIDILSASSTNNKVAWYANDGAGIFSEQIVSISAASAQSVYPVDLDKDGYMDVLATLATEDRIAWYKAKGLKTIDISENTPYADSIMAEDLDENSTLIYTINGGLDSSKLNISNDGNLTFKDINGTDFENPDDNNTDGIYEVQVQVTDEHNASTIVDVEVTITNIFDVKATLENFSANIDENSVDMTIVGTVTGDSGDSAISEYHLVNTSVFSIDSNGTIKVSDPSALNYETNSSFGFQVYANNGAGASNYADVNITLNNVEEPPMLAQISPAYISHTIASGASIDNITVETAGSYPVTNYIFTSGNEKGYFDINSTGSITVSSNAHFHYYEQNEYFLDIKAITADGNATDGFKVTITKEDAVYLRNVVYDNNLTTDDVTDDKLYIYFDVNVTATDLDANPDNDFNVTGTGDIASDSSTDYNASYFYRYTIGATGSSVAFNTNGDRIAILEDAIFSDDYNLSNTASIKVNKFTPLLKTGETLCYDHNETNTTISCSDPDAVGDGVTTTGIDRNYTRDTDTEDEEYVMDHITGLMWQDNATPIEGGNVASTYCSNLTLGVYSDWRLPTRSELFSIVDMGRSNPAIDPIFVKTGGVSWTSTDYSADTNYAWYVDFTDGRMKHNITRADYYYFVRCVRGGN